MRVFIIHCFAVTQWYILMKSNQFGKTPVPQWPVQRFWGLRSGVAHTRLPYRLLVQLLHCLVSLKWTPWPHSHWGNLLHTYPPSHPHTSQTPSLKDLSNNIWRQVCGKFKATSKTVIASDFTQRVLGEKTFEKPGYTVALHPCPFPCTLQGTVSLRVLREEI